MIVTTNDKALATYSCEAKVNRKADTYIQEEINSDDDYMKTFSGSWCGRPEDVIAKNAGK